jgi:hypothetical protein
MEIFEGLNWGLLKKVQVIADENVSFPGYRNPIDFNDFSFKNDADFMEIPFIFESASFNESEKQTDAGMKWSKQVVLSIPKLRNAVSDFLDNYSGKKLALLVTDMNDQTHFVYPMHMARQRNIPGQANGLNSTEVVFLGEWNTESPSVTNLA